MQGDEIIFDVFSFIRIKRRRAGVLSKLRFRVMNNGSEGETRTAASFSRFDLFNPLPLLLTSFYCFMILEISDI